MLARSSAGAHVSTWEIVVEMPHKFYGFIQSSLILGFRERNCRNKFMLLTCEGARVVFSYPFLTCLHVWEGHIWISTGVGPRNSVLCSTLQTLDHLLYVRKLMVKNVRAQPAVLWRDLRILGQFFSARMLMVFWWFLCCLGLHLIFCRIFHIRGFCSVYSSCAPNSPNPEPPILQRGSNLYSVQRGFPKGGRGFN